MRIDKNLHFRRQFLLCKGTLERLANWKIIKIREYYLYIHPDLNVNKASELKRDILLIGDIFDPEEWEKSNADILKKIIINSTTSKECLTNIKGYAGCYAIIYIDDRDSLIFNDARGLREIYFSVKDNRIICASQPNLIYKYAEPKIMPSSNPDLLDFYGNHLRDSIWVGDETYFDGIKHLIPNHYLDIPKKEVHRYWPGEYIRRLNLDEGVSKSCQFLQGIMKAITNRYVAMMAVTAGTDSRTLLAASRAMKEKIYYFINNEGLGRSHPDISIPEKMLREIDIPFHIHEVPKYVSEEFRQIFFSNTLLASERILPSIYNVFYKSHGDKILIIGVGEIGRSRYGKGKGINGHRMAYRMGYGNEKYVNKKCKEILSEMIPVGIQYNINPATLFYWEQMLGNWGAVRNSESLIACDKIDPFDSHLLCETMLGVDEEFRTYKQCILFTEIIRFLWPELLQWPINPAYTFVDKMFGFFREMRIYEPLKEIKYQINHLRYLMARNNYT